MFRFNIQTNTVSYIFRIIRFRSTCSRTHFFHLSFLSHHYFNSCVTKSQVLFSSVEQFNYTILPSLCCA
nr:MAG TPA: hypothetical protein [Caudoviricetes sp.]DAL57295.1 MAG TPA_asm: hypothetical protein [Caudoviricetes sp.]